MKTQLKISTIFPGILCLALWRVQKVWKTISVTLLKPNSVISGFFFHPTSYVPSKSLSVWKAGVSGMVALRMCLLPFSSLTSPRWFKWFSGLTPRGKWDGEHDGAEALVLGSWLWEGAQGGQRSRKDWEVPQKFQPHKLKGDSKSLLCSVPCPCVLHLSACKLAVTAFPFPGAYWENSFIKKHQQLPNIALHAQKAAA